MTTTLTPRTVRASDLRPGDTLLAAGMSYEIAATYNTGEHVLMYPAERPGAEWPLPMDELVTVV